MVFTLKGSLLTVAALAVAAEAGPDPCDPWCLVENPSFELPGVEPGQVLAGWCNFGQVGITVDVAVHGRQSATVSGPGTGGWDISAYWQPIVNGAILVFAVYTDVIAEQGYFSKVFGNARRQS